MIDDRERRDRSNKLPDLEDVLEAIRFTPRPSLKAEIHSRYRKEKRSGSESRDRIWLTRFSLGLGVAAGLVGLVVWASGPTRLAPVPDPSSGVARVNVDWCCADLDGGGFADDGVLVEAGAAETVLNLSIYEDTDGTRSFSSGDLMRATPGMHERFDGPVPHVAVTSDHCCSDYDAGRSPDDGIFLVSVPPDRILLAALYEDLDESGNVSAADLVRYVLR